MNTPYDVIGQITLTPDNGSGMAVLEADFAALLKLAELQHDEAIAKAHRQFWMLVAHYMDAKLLTQKAIAELLGVTRETVRTNCLPYRLAKS